VIDARELVADFAGLGDVDRKPLFLQASLEDASRLLVVLHQQDTHRAGHKATTRRQRLVLVPEEAFMQSCFLQSPGLDFS